MRILNSLDGRKAGFDQNGKLISVGGFTSGDHGKQVSHESPATVTLFDDFLGDLIADEWDLSEGSDSATSTAAILAGGIGGVLQFTTGDVTGVTAANLLANAEHLTQALQWQASNGGLVFQCRIKLSSVTTGWMFLGFTDLAGTAELPIESAASADTITTNATDAVGFLFDPRMVTNPTKVFLVGVANDVDATVQVSSFAPTANQYATYRVELNLATVGATNATATFFINGAQVGTAMSGALVAATDLTPVVSVSKSAADTTSITAQLDYVHVAMNRAADGGAT
jgi:hypothetical protein